MPKILSLFQWVRVQIKLFRIEKNEFSLYGLVAMGSRSMKKCHDHQTSFSSCLWLVWMDFNTSIDEEVNLIEKGWEFLAKYTKKIIPVYDLMPYSPNNSSITQTDRQRPLNQKSYKTCLISDKSCLGRKQIRFGRASNFRADFLHSTCLQNDFMSA